MKNYFEYTQRNIPYSIFGKGKLNGYYDLSFFLDYDEYKNPKLINVLDGSRLVPDNYLKSNKRLLVAEHTMSQQEKEEFISGIPSEFNLIQVEPINWIKENTNLVEKEPGVFIKGTTEEGEELLLTID